MSNDPYGIRPGEVAVELPKEFDAGLYFIGRIHTPWATRDECPKNARESDAVPLGRMLPEIGLCRGRAGGTYRREALTVARHHAIIGIEQRRERAGELGLVAVLR